MLGRGCLVMLLLFACRRARDAPPEATAFPPERAPAIRLQLPLRGPVTRMAVSGSVLAVGLGGGFHGVDPRTGRARWTLRAAAALHGPIADGADLFLPWTEGPSGIVVRVDPPSGAVRSRTAVRATGAPPGMSLAFNTPPAVSGGLILWPTSRSLFAFDTATGANRWRYDATGPTPYRRFHFGSDPPVVSESVVYWGHGQGVAALDLASGRERWARPLYRGFALPPVVSGERVFVTSDTGVLALARGTGGVIWHLAPAGLRFEHLAAEPLLGASGGRLWFVGEPEPFRYRLYLADAATGSLLGSSALAASGVQGPAVSDGARVYLRHGARLVAYDLTSGAPLWSASVGAGRGSASMAVVAGRVWVATEGGVLMAFEAWP